MPGDPFQVDSVFYTPHKKKNSIFTFHRFVLLKKNKKSTKALSLL